MKDWLTNAIKEGADRGLSQAGLAAHCRVTRQAVNGWVRTGRIAKGHLTAAVNYFGHAPDFAAAADGAASVTHLRAEVPRMRYTLPQWPFELIDAQLVQQLDNASRLRLETIVLTVAAQLGMAIGKQADA